MADRGSIGVSRSDLFATLTNPTGFWAGSSAISKSYLYSVGTLPDGYWRGAIVIGGEVRDVLRYNQPGKRIAGTVTLDGEVVGRTVRIHHRGTGLPCVTMTSGVDGSYQSDGFASDNEYYVVALPSSADGSNAVIADRVRGA